MDAVVVPLDYRQHMASGDDELTFEQLAALSMDERVRYFLNHPVPGDAPGASPLKLARQLARTVDLVVARDSEQRAS